MEEEIIDANADKLVYDIVTNMWMSQKALDNLIAERKKKTEEKKDGE